MNELTRIVAMREPPSNVHAFLAETAHGLGELYGPAAADEYRANAPGILAAALTHPGVRAYAALDDHNEARAILMAVMKPPIASVVYLHVLASSRDKGIEAELLRHALTELTAEPVEGIVSEYLATQPQDLEAIYREFQFTPEPRTLMLAPLDAPALQAGAAPVSLPITHHEWDAAARILVEAYRRHPGRRLHLEVRDVRQARAFLQTVARGGYGAFDPSFARLHRSEHAAEPDGMIIGGRAAPGVGFVLHVAVRPEAQGKGIGTTLLQDIATHFREAGYDRIGLGVTDGNPAHALYERLGFQPIGHLTAWYWWR